MKDDDFNNDDDGDDFNDDIQPKVKQRKKLDLCYPNKQIIFDV